MLHQIGVGALGPVFRTYEPTRDRLVAVKVFRLDITPEQSASLAEALARAAEAGLFHPSIVEPIAAGIEGTLAYRAEEYVAAESLDVAMRHYAPASPDKVLPFITQLAGAIDFARAAGVGHGALHPRDIFVTPEEARATGFGVVDALERVGLRAPVRRPYSAPERVDSEAWGTPADVFSLAAIAFELLTGRRPSGIGDQIGPLAGGPVAAHSARIHAVLVRAMDADPARRYPSTLAFAGALEAASRGEVTSGAVPVATGAAAAQDFALDRAELSRPSAEAAPPVVPARDGAEREEDEPQWELTRDGSRTVGSSVAPGREEEPLFKDETMPAASDSLAMDAVDLALREPAGRVEEEPQFADEFREAESRAPEPPPPARKEGDRASAPSQGPASVTSIGIRRDAQSRPAVHPVPPPPRERQVAERLHKRERPQKAEEPPIAAERALFESHMPPERTPPAMLPIAFAVLLSLLLGFAAGYAVRARQSGPATFAQGATQSPPATAPDTQASGTPQGRGKEWSEQAVSQPPARQPAVPSEPVAAKPPGPARATGPSAAAPRTGKIVVRSRPSGASVSVNGRWRGRTPLVLDNAAFGKYALRVVLPGYDVERENFSLSASDASRSISFDLKRQPAAVAQASKKATPTKAAPTGTATTGILPGSIFVDSNPRGARIFLDGKAMGTTPLRIPEVPIGSHVVRLELPDHRAWTGATTVVSGKDARVTGSLEPIR